MNRTDILIVGGGIAGLGAAASLAARGARRVLLLDREAQPGFYASGHNAAIVRQLTGRAEHTELTIDGARRLREAGLSDGRGGFLLEAETGGLDALQAEVHRFGLDATRSAGSPLSGLNAVSRLGVSGDGILDPDRTLAVCSERAKAHGAQIRFDCGVGAIHPAPDGFEVETDLGTLRTDVLVNAAGAWAGRIGAMAGGLSLDLQPLRRHLVWSPAPCPQSAPWAWWVDRPLYLRPESGGLLLCPCDETEVAAPTLHRQPDVDRGVLEGLHASLQEVAPALADLPVQRIWSGLRTFAPDRRFLLGWDPLNPRLFWIAGLGGHGMTSGLAVAERAARLILEGGEGALSPRRFHSIRESRVEE